MPCLKIGLCQALTLDVRDALASSGVRNVDEFIAADLEALTKACNVPYKDLVSIRRVLLAQFSAFPVNGSQLYEDVLTSTSILNTGKYPLFHASQDQSCLLPAKRLMCIYYVFNIL